ncbi:MAG TPA: protein kinase [Terriglobales bacterium]|nr:protein kinase [Terriglobales bacterium]
MALASSTRLGPYEILSPLGAGGMGEVYRARDTRLGRDVALKILPESFAHDQERLRRFEQEARAVAALNHPNIVAIYDVGQSNGTPFLVSELLEGESLRTVLDRGPMTQRKATEFAVQVAQGLAAAHEKGIIHRDLKPENLYLTRDGHTKILDFGLAKLARGSGETDADSVTLASSHTAPGMVMGTANYMAPEQVRGEATDARTDIFALGSVLFEMLSGERAFQRDTPAETMTAVLKEDPPELSDPARPVSPALERIVRRCLEKHPGQRFQSAKDLSFALSALSGSDVSSAARTVNAPRGFPLAVAAAVAAALLIGAGVSWIVARRPAALTTLQFAIPVRGEVSHMALSADGSILVFVSPEEDSGLPMLYVQHVGAAAATPLAGTEGASYPFLSPDGAYVGFFANGKLQKVATTGGTPQVLASALSARGGTWGRRNVIIYAPDVGGVGLWRVNADGSGAAPLTEAIRTATENTHRWPVFLPDGSHFLFWGGNFSNAADDRTSGIYVSSLDGKERKLVVLCHSSFAIDSGHLFYADDDRHLVSRAFEPSSATVSGAATVISDTVGYQPSTYWVALTASENGTLVYSTRTGADLSVLTWVDRTGKEVSRMGEPAVQANPAISPDGSRIALDISDQKANSINVWLENVNQKGMMRFTFSPSEVVVPVWSRDGSTLAYRSNVANSTLFTKRATGLEREQMRLELSASDDIFPNSWSADDQQILCEHQGLSGHQLLLVPAKGGSAVPFLNGKGNQTNGQISPDGKWVAYASDELGSWQIFVTTFPTGAGKWQISRGGGTEPRWRGDGKELFYIDPKGTLTAVPVSFDGTFSSGAPTPLFQVHARAQVSSTDVFTYDVTRDGNLFLMNRYWKPASIAPLMIVLHTNSSSPSGR